MIALSQRGLVLANIHVIGLYTTKKIDQKVWFFSLHYFVDYFGLEKDVYNDFMKATLHYWKAIHSDFPLQVIGLGHLREEKFETFKFEKRAFKLYPRAAHLSYIPTQTAFVQGYCYDRGVHKNCCVHKNIARSRECERVWNTPLDMHVMLIVPYTALECCIIQFVLIITRARSQ